MELRQLEYFQMASRLRNITRAAERLRVSQPNITVAIKKLEAELGIQLFDRSQKQLALTPEGAVFLNRIELALRNIQDAVLEVNDYKQLQKGTIKIGIPPISIMGLGRRWLSSLMRVPNPPAKMTTFILPFLSSGNTAPDYTDIVYQYSRP